VKRNELPWLQIPFKMLTAIHFSETGLHLFRRNSTGLLKIEFRPYMYATSFGSFSGHHQAYQCK